MYVQTINNSAGHNDHHTISVSVSIAFAVSVAMELFHALDCWYYFNNNNNYYEFYIATATPTIYTTKGDACVCVCAKLDQFLPVRSHFDTKRPVNCFHIATFPSPTFGPLFAFHCPLFFTKNNNLHAAMF